MKSVTRARKPFYLSPTEDGVSLSTNWRHEGKLLFLDGKLFESLEAYNKSLCVAQFGSIDIPLAFAGRSAVYFEAKEYQLSLDNINLAREHDVPADQLSTLSQREEKCKVLIESQQKSDDDDPWTFFKLSYPANKKIPFIVDCLELQNSEQFGRFLITSQDLHPGDVIAIEEPFVKIVHSESAHTRCSNCLKSNKMSLIPSRTGQTAMFCSTSCLESASEVFLHPENVSRMHDIKQRMLFEALAVCGGSFEKLKELMEETELEKKTIFDFDFSDPNDPHYKHNLLLSIISLVQASKVSDEVVRYLSNHPVLDTLKSQADKDIAKDFLLRSFKMLTVNSFGIEWVVPAKPTDFNKESVNTKLAGDGLCQFGSLINHSCSPNIDRLFVDNKFVFYVRRPILKGQQLFTCYGTLFLDAPRELRQETLQDEYGFLCSCEACNGDYPSAMFYPWKDVPIIITERSKVNEWKDQFKKNCRKIVKGQTTLSHSEMCVLMLKNLYYLVAIAKTEPFIF